MNQNDIKESINELYHHGTKGMKWGVRRYQNKDGSLTAAGRKRQRMSQDAKDAYYLKRKRVYELSNAELIRLNNRQSLERNYRQSNPNAITRGMRFVGVVAGTLGTIAGIQKNGKKVISMGKSITDKILKKK